jgi:hypothetical protein
MERQMEHANYEMCQSWVLEQRTPDGLPATAPGTGFSTGWWVKTIRQFRPTGACLFVGGLEGWYQAQIYWFSGSFRWQALGVLLLIYWILGALWCMRDR